LNRRQAEDAFVHSEAVNLISQQEETRYEQHESDSRFLLHFAITSGPLPGGVAGALRLEDCLRAAEDVSQNGDKKKKHEQEEENFRNSNRCDRRMSETQHHRK